MLHARGWGLRADVTPIMHHQGTQVVALNAHIVRIGGQSALCKYDAGGRLLYDLRLWSFHGIPVLVNACAAVQPAQYGDFIDHLIHAAAAALRVEGAAPLALALTTHASPALAADGSEQHVYEFQPPAGTGTGGGEPVSWVRFAPRTAQGEWIVGQDDLDGGLTPLYDVRTGRIYAYSGPLQRPTAAYEIVWVKNRPPALIPLAARDWSNLRPGAPRDRLLELLRTAETALCAANPHLAARKAAEQGPPPATWDAPPPDLPLSERVPFLFHVPVPTPEPASDLPEVILGRLQGQFFNPVPAAQEDMAYGTPPVGTERHFTFVGQRGDVLSVKMTFTWYQNQHAQRTLGWVVHPAVHAKDEVVDVRVNGTRLAHVSYDREGSAQVLRMGAAAVAVQLRYFSWELGGGGACFGFREGLAATDPEGRKNYTQARARLKRLLEVSGVWNGRYVAEEIAAEPTEGGWVRKHWRLMRRGHSGSDRVEICYFVSVSVSVSASASSGSSSRSGAGLSSESGSGDTAASLGADNAGQALQSLEVTVNGTPVTFAAFAIPGTQALYLREELPPEEADATVVSRRRPTAHLPRRMILALAPDGSPLLREFAPNDLDLTQAYLDDDVWPDEFVPIVKMGIHRGPLSIFNTQRVREWAGCLFPDDNPAAHRGTAGLLSWSRQYTVGDPVWGARLAKLIVTDPEEYARLGWSSGSRATRAQAAEYFEERLELRAGGAAARGAVLMPADLEADPFFADMGAVRIFGFIGHLAARETPGVDVTRGGVPVIRREALPSVLTAAAAELAAWHQLHPTIDGRRHQSLDAARHAGDDRDLHDKIASDAPRPDQSLAGRDRTCATFALLSGDDQDVMRRFLSGENAPEIARTTCLSLDEVMAIIDRFEDAMEDAAAGID